MECFEWRFSFFLFFFLLIVRLALLSGFAKVFIFHDTKCILQNQNYLQYICLTLEIPDHLLVVDLKWILDLRTYVLIVHR